MKNTARTFVAIDFDQSIKTTLMNAQKKLMALNCDIRWVTEQNMHLTLKFLGEVDIENIPGIAQTLETICLSCRTFPIQLGQWGAFPSADHPKILWVGINDPAQRIPEIILSLNQKMEEMGPQDNKDDFIPHATIGRVRTDKNLGQLKRQLKTTYLSENPRQIVRHLTFFKSTLISSGAVYQKLGQFPLLT